MEVERMSLVKGTLNSMLEMLAMARGFPAKAALSPL
jgi:hypothetical protein